MWREKQATWGARRGTINLLLYDKLVVAVIHERLLFLIIVIFKGIQTRLQGLWWYALYASYACDTILPCRPLAVPACGRHHPPLPAFVTAFVFLISLCNMRVGKTTVNSAYDKGASCCCNAKTLPCMVRDAVC